MAPHQLDASYAQILNISIHWRHQAYYAYIRQTLVCGFIAEYASYW